MKVAPPPLRGAVPTWLAPLKKAIVPVGVPLPDAGVAVAVITTGPLKPKVTEAGASAKAVVVATRQLGNLKETMRVFQA